MTKILVVDDEPDVVNYISDELQMSGYQSGPAHDGVEAVLSVIDGGWDIVLMDIRMPKLDGIGALRIMRRLDPHLPIIMFTGQAGQGDMAESSRLGAFTCLLKPVSTEKLVTSIQQALHRRST